MDGIITIVALVVGLPVIGGSLIAITALLRGWWLKARELRLREEQLKLEERRRTDEYNARILKMDDMGISPVEFASLCEEVRQLKQEIARLHEQMVSR